MRAILKKELKSYFLSPTGYIVIGIFLLFFNVSFMFDILNSGTIELTGLYSFVAAWGLVLIIPILTMRSFAEERKTGTEQLLLTSPTSVFKIIMGKFLAASSVILITLILSLVYYIILCFFGNPSIVTILVQILGILLLSMAGISVGLFASSLTENQVVAGIITIAFLILNIFVDTKSLNLLNYYYNFVTGVISTEDVIALILYSFVFISFTVIVLQRRKLVK